MSRETDQNKLDFVSSEQNMKDGEHDSESNFPQNSTEQQPIITQQQLIPTEPDPRDTIRERIEVVYQKIDEKRRRLLLKDREFIIVNLKDLQDSLTKIIQALEDRLSRSSSDNLDSNTVEANTVPLFLTKIAIALLKISDLNRLLEKTREKLVMDLAVRLD